MRTPFRRAIGAIAAATVAGTAIGGSVYKSVQNSGLAPVAVSPNGPYLVRGSTPFLLQGDTAGSIIDISEADAATYFAARQAQGFNAVMFRALCGDYTGCPTDGSTVDGIRPFTSGASPSTYDIATPNAAYWQRITDFVNLANQHQIVPLIDTFETSSWLPMLRNGGATKAFNYGAYIGGLFKSKDVIWWLGNDFQTYTDATDANLALQVMNGIHSVDTTHLQTSQLNYYVSASLDSATLAPRITLNGVYTYYPTYAEVLAARAESATTPVFMQEANFETLALPSPAELGTPTVLRRQEWWTALSGGLAGQLYGNINTHHFVSGWPSHLNDPGAIQFGYETVFMRQLPWTLFVPDSGHTVLTAGFGTFNGTCNQCVSTNDYAAASRASDGSTVAVYTPTVRALTIDMTKLAGATVTAQWFDPTSNTYTAVAGQPFANTGSRTFTPTGNNSAGATDWVLLLTS